MVTAWWFVLSQGQAYDAGAIVGEALEFVRNLLGTGSDQPSAYVQAERWREVGFLALETLAMGVLAVGLAGLTALVTVPFAARTLTVGALADRHPVAGRVVFVATRAAHVVARAVPDLVWALLVVFVFQPGVLAGALALAIHNFGVMGRLGADVVEDLDPGPVASLRAAGASTGQVLAYGVVPQVLPQYLTFLLFRWEVIMRATAVVGLVVPVGLGYRLRLALSFFDWTLVGLILAAYVLLVLGVDLASAGLRRLAR